MKKTFSAVLACSVAAAVSQVAIAGTDIFFNPLTQSSAVATPNHVNELNSPWQTPAGLSQENLMSLREVEADFTQSVVRVSEAGVGGPSRLPNASMIDMVAYDKKGKYVFLPHETFTGAGVSRYDIKNDRTEVLFRGNEGGLAGDWSNDWGAFDPSTWTTNNTLFLAEEWSGEGRVMEVMNPYADPADIQIRELESIPNVSHEGLRFSNNGKTLYFVDENNSGSIYKIVFKKKKNYTKGRVFVLAVDAFAGNPAENYNSATNATEPRTGLATWVPMTNKKGKYLTSIDPFDNAGGPGARAGRLAADELNATPFGRPEDIEVSTLKDGSEVLYFAATSEATVYSVEMVNGNQAIVREFASEANTPKNKGFPATTAILNSPDNLAQDALGNIYIIEDKPNGDDVGGDIWFVRDKNSDGVAESIDHFMSIQVDGAEATGMIFNPAKPTEFVIAVQHPDSTNLSNVPGGFGDALWKFDLTDIVPPTCNKRNKPTCSKANDFKFVKQLKKAAK